MLLTVRPGMTDPASLAYHDEARHLAHAIDPEKEYVKKILPAKIQLSRQYVAGSTICEDLMILFKNFVCSGAFARQERGKMVEMCRLVSRLFCRDIRFPVHVLAGIWLMAFTLGLVDTGLAQDSEFVLRGTIHAGATQMVAQDTRLAVADAQTLRIFDISEF